MPDHDPFRDATGSARDASRTTDSGATNPGATDPIGDQVRALARWTDEHHAPSFDPGSLRTRADLGDTRAITRGPSPFGGTVAHRAGAALLAAATLAAVVGIGIAATRGGDDPSLRTGTSSGATAPATTSAPRPTVIPPVEDDPLVTCDTHNTNRVFRQSALEGPTGAEYADDPAAAALRIALGRPADGGPGDIVSQLPEQGWRRLADHDDVVLFGTGTLPRLAFIEVARSDDGTWRAGASGGGECGLTTAPEGRTTLGWGFERGGWPTRDSVELHLVIDDACPRPLDPARLLGPDVVEDDERVTIRVAYDEPLLNHDDPACGFATGGRMTDRQPLRVTVPLSRPLGDRKLYDGDAVPPSLREEIIRQEGPALPEVDAGGDTEIMIDVLSNRLGVCQPPIGDQSGCPNIVAPERVRSITVTSATGVYTAPGGAVAMFKVRVPDGPVTVTVDGDDLWCPERSSSDGGGNSITVLCTDLRLPHATVRGHLVGSGPERFAMAFRGGSRYGPFVVLAPVSADGSFEVVLEPGSWTAGVQAARPLGAKDSDRWMAAGVSCDALSRPTFTVTDGVDQSIDVPLPTCFGE